MWCTFYIECLEALNALKLSAALVRNEKFLLDSKVGMAYLKRNWVISESQNWSLKSCGCAVSPLAKLSKELSSSSRSGLLNQSLNRTVPRNLRFSDINLEKRILNKISYFTQLHVFKKSSFYVSTSRVYVKINCISLSFIFCQHYLFFLYWKNVYL